MERPGAFGSSSILAVGIDDDTSISFDHAFGELSTVNKNPSNQFAGTMPPAKRDFLPGTTGQFESTANLNADLPHSKPSTAGKIAEQMELSFALFKENLKSKSKAIPSALNAVTNQLKKTPQPHTSSVEMSLSQTTIDCMEPSAVDELKSKLEQFDRLSAFIELLEELAEEHANVVKYCSNLQDRMGQALKEFSRYQGDQRLAKSSMDLGEYYQADSSATRSLLTTRMNVMNDFLFTISRKAIADVHHSVKKLQNARITLDFYAGKVTELENRLASNSSASAASSSSSLFGKLTIAQPSASATQSSLRNMREQMHKSRDIHNLAVREVCDKIAMIQLKMKVDLSNQLQELLDSHRLLDIRRHSLH